MSRIRDAIRSVLDHICKRHEEKLVVPYVPPPSPINQKLFDYRKEMEDAIFRISLLCAEKEEPDHFNWKGEPVYKTKGINSGLIGDETDFGGTRYTPKVPTHRWIDPYGMGGPMFKMPAHSKNYQPLRWSEPLEGKD